MAYRVEIGEIVENATGLNVTGASVTVKVHGGANAAVYDAENGGALVTQPLSTVNGKIGADYPSGAWVAEGDYDLVVAGGAPAGGDLTFFWSARRATQFVTNLPAGAGTSAPEDGELAIQLYDGTNKAAWLRRYRGATSDWDMIGGPPPAGGSLPGSPIARQEFYITGSTPPVIHQRYNGSSWDYVGTPPTVPVTGSPLSILEVGQSGQHRAGRQLALADFTTLLGVTSPILLANLTTLTSNLGSGGALVNKNTTLNGNGIDGSATAAQFDGTISNKALYTLDTGAADPYRIKMGTVGCWFKTAKRSTTQSGVTKWSAAAATRSFFLGADSTNVANIQGSDGTNTSNALGTSDICDDRWHHLAATFDGTWSKLYVDGVLEAVAGFNGVMNQSATAPFNIGGYLADAGTNPTNPSWGRVDEAFVTGDVLTEDQIRLLYAGAFPHGYSTTPTRAELSVRRKLRGADWANGDFPSQPVRYYDGGSLTDKGTGATNLTANNTPVIVAGPDGRPAGAYNFVAASSQSLSATDTGLPSGTSSRSGGCWFKTTVGGGGILAWGTITTNDFRIDANAGSLRGLSGGDVISGPYVADGLWHFVAMVEENSPVDGLKRKLYLDGRLVGSSTTLTSLTLAGANSFRVGSASNGTSFHAGQIAQDFVFAGALTAEQIQVLYQKTARVLPTSIKSDAGANIEAIDATNVYAILDSIDSQNTIDLAVAS